MKQIDPTKLRPGLIMQARSPDWGGRLIRWSLSKWIRRERGPGTPECWGSHTSLVVEIDDELFIGDSMAKNLGAGFFPFSRPTPVAEWNKDLAAGCHEAVRFFEVIGATPRQEHQASNWWVANVNGRPYDFMAFPRLLGKCLIKSFTERAAGWTWGWFCSEGVAQALNQPFFPGPGPIGPGQATPMTFEIRAGLFGDPATLREITDQVLVDQPAEQVPAPKSPPPPLSWAHSLLAIAGVATLAAALGCVQIENTPPGASVTVNQVILPWRSIVGTASNQANSVEGGGHPTLKVTPAP